MWRDHMGPADLLLPQAYLRQKVQVVLIMSILNDLSLMDINQLNDG